MLILPRRNFVSSPALNPLGPNIHTQIPYTDLHTLYERISWGFDKRSKHFSFSWEKIDVDHLKDLKGYITME